MSTPLHKKRKFDEVETRARPFLQMKIKPERSDGGVTVPLVKVTFVRDVSDSKKPNHVQPTRQLLKQELDGKRFVCAECERKVVFKKEHKRKRKTNQTIVSAHFAHAPIDKATDHQQTCTGGESMMHKECKKWMMNNWDRVTFFRRCAKGEHERYIPTKPILSIKEPHVQVQTEVAWKDRRFDVAVVDTKTNAPLFVVEIWHTHAIGPEKKLDLDNAAIPFVEIKTLQIEEKWGAHRKSASFSMMIIPELATSVRVK